MSKSTSKFPTFEFAVDSQAQINQLRGEILLLEEEQKRLTPNQVLSPLEAARDLVKREDAIAKDLRERRLALTVSDPDTSPLWRQAVSEMRPEVGRIENELNALVDKANRAVIRLLAPITQHSGYVARYAAVTVIVGKVVTEFRSAFFAAANAQNENLPSLAIQLHAAIEEIPAKIKELQSLIATTEKAADDMERHFPVASAEEVPA